MLRTLESKLDLPNSFRSKVKQPMREALVETLAPQIGEVRARRFTRGHETYEIKERLLDPDVLASYFKFAFVRNPYDRLYSAFNDHRKNRTTLWSKLTEKESSDFNAFVQQRLTTRMFSNGEIDESCLDEDTIYIHFFPQHLFVCREGEIAVDSIGRMERFDEDFAAILERLGQNDGKLVTRHILYRGDLTAPSRYLEHYDPASIEIVNRLYAQDFELFGYSRRSAG